MSKEKSIKFNKSGNESRIKKFLDSIRIVRDAYKSAYDDDNNGEVKNTGSNPEIDRIFAQAENNIAAASRAYEPTKKVGRPAGRPPVYSNKQQYINRPSEEDLYKMRARNNGDDEISNENEIGNK